MRCGALTARTTHLRQHSARGILSMANSGPNTNASQFFMTYAKHAHLNGAASRLSRTAWRVVTPGRRHAGKYTVFGRVISGLEVLDQMEKASVHLPTQRLLARSDVAHLHVRVRRRRATQTMCRCPTYG